METDLNKLNEQWDKRMAEQNRQPIHKSDMELMIAYRNGIAFSAAILPRLDDINARFLMEDLKGKIAEVLSDFDEKRRELYARS